MAKAKAKKVVKKASTGARLPPLDPDMVFKRLAAAVKAYGDVGVKSGELVRDGETPVRVVKALKRLEEAGRAYMTGERGGARWNVK